MKFSKLLVVIVISAFFLAIPVFSQTTDEQKKAAMEQTPKVNKGNVPKATIKRPAGSTAPTEQPFKKAPDVPEVPLTNARITYDYTTFDFGIVPPGAQITHHFPVRNEGSDTLVITKIKAG